MASYTITYRKSVAKDLRAIPPQARKAIVKHILTLADEPHPFGSVKLHGSKNLYRLRYADYRVIYLVHKGAVIILIIKVGHRKAVYKNL